MIKCFIVLLLLAISTCSVQIRHNSNADIEMKASSPQASELVLNTEQRSFPTTLEHVQLFDEAHWLIADSNQVCKTDDAGKSW